MRRTDFVKVFIISLAIFSQAGFVFGYKDATTHPALTSETVKFYNLSFDNKLTEEEKKWLVAGSREEDTAPRWINHFYDPVYNEGWTGEKGPAGFSENIMKKFSDVFLSSEDTLSAIDWAQNQKVQKKYKLYKGNKTWQNAVYQYVANKDKKSALTSLGYVLHLVQDMSVPEHTRNDTHPGDSPYENYCDRFNINNFRVAGELVKSNYKPVIFDSLNEYMRELALYSNNYFFSKDTINDPKYMKPEVVGKYGDFGHGVDWGGEIFNLVYVDELWNQEKLDYDVVLTLEDKPSYYPILSAYWTRLSREAILHGAGVIDLFFKEVEKAQNNPSLLSPPPKSQSAMLSVFGEVKRASRGLSRAKDWTLTTILNTKDKLVSTFSNIFSSTTNTNTPPGGGPAIVLQKQNDNQNGEQNNEPDFNLSTPPKISSEGQSHMGQITPSPTFAPTPTPTVVIPKTLSKAQNIFSLTAIPFVGIGGGAEPQTVGSPTSNSLGQATPTPTPTPTSTPTPTNTPTPTPIPTSTPQPTPTPTPQPPGPPTITNPQDTNQIFKANKITFSGTTPAETTVKCTFMRAGDTQSTVVFITPTSSNRWTFIIALNGGINNLTFRAVNQNDLKSEAVRVTIQVDTTPPDIFFNINECGQDALFANQNECLTTEAELTLNWYSTSTNISYYELTTNNQTSTTTATTTTTTVPNNSTNTFSVKAIDQANNSSLEKQIIVTTNKNPIVINEVGWGGTGGQPQNEYIELYNKTGFDIDFALTSKKFTLYSQTDEGPYIKLEGQILAHGYYLIERTDDDTIPTIIADMTTSFKNGLKNTGEILKLTYASTTIDQTATTTNGKWPAGTSSGRSMERYNHNELGTNPTNWGANNMLITTGNINGTPKAKNSISYYINKNQKIIQNLTLTNPENSYYLVNNKILEVAESVTLTIEPGTIIKFYNDASLRINGKIIADGTPISPITFTSFDLTPKAGDWFGITISTNAQDGSIFNHTKIKYGGKYYTGQNQQRANLASEGPTIIVSNSTIEHSKIYGIKLIGVGAQTQITNNIFAKNNQSPDPAGINSALNIIGGNPEIKNNTFTQNKNGIRLTNSGANTKITTNTFNSNSGMAIYSNGAIAQLTSNTGSNNSINAIALAGPLTNPGDATSTLYQNSLPYFLTGSASTISSSSTLIIKSGTIIKGDKRLMVNGNLIIDGTNPQNILFTSKFDDSDGNDTTNDGNNSTPQAGDFPGIYISNAGSLSAKGFTMRYAGGTGYGSNDSAGITIDGGLATILNAVISNNYPHGINAKNSQQINIENARFENHNQTGSWGTKAALKISNSTTTLINVTFSNNRLGIKSDTISTFITSGISWLNNILNTIPDNLF